MATNDDPERSLLEGWLAQPSAGAGDRTPNCRRILADNEVLVGQARLEAEQAGQRSRGADPATEDR